LPCGSTAARWLREVLSAPEQWRWRRKRRWWRQFFRRLPVRGQSVDEPADCRRLFAGQFRAERDLRLSVPGEPGTDVPGYHSGQYVFVYGERCRGYLRLHHRFEWGTQPGKWWRSRRDRRRALGAARGFDRAVAARSRCIRG